MLRIVEERSEEKSGELRTLDELAREGARRMLVFALDEEVESYVAAHVEARDERGHRLVVRNGHLPERSIQTPMGEIPIKQPRVRDRRDMVYLPLAP